MKAKFWIALSVLTVCTAAVADRGKMYKWTDENGVVHFSEAPPASESASSERMNIPGVDQRAIGRRAQLEGDDDDGDDDGEQQSGLTRAMAEDPAIAAQLQKQCADVRRNIAVLRSEYSRVKAYDAEGNPRELDAAQRQARLEREQEYIKTYCS